MLFPSAGMKNGELLPGLEVEETEVPVWLLPFPHSLSLTLYPSLRSPSSPVMLSPQGSWPRGQNFHFVLILIRPLISVRRDEK